MRQSRIGSSWLDAFAVGASAACLVHCLVIPLLLALAPALVSLIGMPEWFHLAAFAFAVPTSALAMQRGFRDHGVVMPAIFAAIGLALLGLGALGGFSILLETGLTVPGSVVLAIGHIGNWKLLRRA
jgi:hypothetical protein